MHTIVDLLFSYGIRVRVWIVWYMDAQAAARFGSLYRSILTIAQKCWLLDLSVQIHIDNTLGWFFCFGLEAPISSS